MIEKVIIRGVQGLEEFKALETLQKETWQSEDLVILPAHHLHALSDNGAIILGAFTEQALTPANMVGFIVGIIGTVEDGLEDRRDDVAAARLKLYSAIMGVHPTYQNLGLGYQLKLAQRQEAMRLGLRMINWTFDPLETRNAQLNIGKLGGICRQYLPNYHGQMAGINGGVPTDRFKVEWWITNNRAKSRVDKGRSALSLQAMLDGGAEIINPLGFNQHGFAVPPERFGPLSPLMFLVEVPTNFQLLKQTDVALALAWRQHTEAIFTGAFERGYMVTDFIYHRGEEDMSRAFYLLTNQSG
ncbi:MAG TPA: hypothetical protein VLL52_12605 [Anaerolineae bacterium]|nr:hypothetical protein [Anaerolineae bacterium]